MNSIISIESPKSDRAFAASQDATEIRIERVLTIRRQLGEGRYHVAEKLNVVTDRILEELLNNSDFKENS
jgi:hypothetical protein